MGWKCWAPDDHSVRRPTVHQTLKEMSSPADVNGVALITFTVTLM